MESRNLIMLLLHIGISFASHQSHNIPVEGYKTELQNLGEHVEIPETPIRVIKITKTVAVKIPVPYPVKVVEKVPYPVHVNKPYPVSVPQIVKVPYNVGSNSPHAHHALDIGQSDSVSIHNNLNNIKSYQDHENIGHNDSPSNYEQIGQSYNGPNYGSYNVPITDEYVDGSPDSNYLQHNNHYPDLSNYHQ